MTHARDAGSNFRARLEALRHGKQQPVSESPPDTSDPPKPSPSFPSREDLRTRLSAKFQAKPETSADTLSANEPPGVTAPPELNAPQIALTPKMTNEEKTELWNAEYGGACTNCNHFNPGHVVFCQFCEHMLLRSGSEHLEVVTSYPLKQVKGLAVTFLNKLAELKIQTTEDMLRVASSAANRNKISSWTGLSERTLLKLVHISNLCRIPSITPEYAFMLDFIAVSTLDELLTQTAEKINTKIQQNKNKINQMGILVLPTRKQIGQWLEEAQELPALKIL
jgi:hypothetical protein